MKRRLFRRRRPPMPRIKVFEEDAYGSYCACVTVLQSNHVQDPVLLTLLLGRCRDSAPSIDQRDYWSDRLDVVDRGEMFADKIISTDVVAGPNLEALERVRTELADDAALSEEMRNL